MVKAKIVGAYVQPPKAAKCTFTLRIREDGAGYCSVWLTSKQGAVRCGCLYGTMPSEVAEALALVWQGEVQRD